MKASGIRFQAAGDLDPMKIGANTRGLGRASDSAVAVASSDEKLTAET